MQRMGRRVGKLGAAVIFRTQLSGPAHGHAIAKHIQRTSEGLLQVETSSLYPALNSLEAKHWVTALWRVSDEGKPMRSAVGSGADPNPGRARLN